MQTSVFSHFADSCTIEREAQSPMMLAAAIKRWKSNAKRIQMYMRPYFTVEAWMEVEILVRDAPHRTTRHYILIGLTLTLFPRRRFRRALSPRRVPSARPLRLAPWASGVAPGLIRTARARAIQSYKSRRSVKTPTLAFPGAFRRRSREARKKL